MDWKELCEEPSLQDLPFKIELNEYGQVVTSPASNQHGRLQARLIILLTQFLPYGEVISECSVQTSSGVKVADVAWASADFLKRHGYSTPYPEAPEICLEISSPSNSERELSAKRELHFERGATEVWVCDAFGNVDFYLVKEFPSKV